MFTVTKTERAWHISLIKQNTDIPLVPNEHCTMYIVYHLASSEFRTDSGILIPEIAEKEVKLAYRNYPAGIALVVASSKDRILSEEEIESLYQENQIGPWIEMRQSVKPGDYVRFDPAGAHEFTGNNGVKMLHVNSNEMRSLIAAYAIVEEEASAPPSMKTSHSNDDASELKW